MQPHLSLRILEGAIAVAQTSLNTSQDQTPVPDDPAVQIPAAIRLCLRAHHGVLNPVGMIASHKKQRHIQHADHEFQVVIRQVPTAQYQIHIPETFFHLGAVDRVNLLIAQREYFQWHLDVTDLLRLGSDHDYP